MEYTEITEKQIAERDRCVRAIQATACIRTPQNKPQKANKKGKPLHTGNSITYFAKNMLGIRPYAWQHVLFEKILKNDKHVIACTPRQVGKSLAVAVASIHASVLNLYPVKSKGDKTIIGIVSKSLDQSKHLMKSIKELLYMGDIYLNKQSDPNFHDYFKRRRSKMREDLNNKTSITFREPVFNEDTNEWEAKGKLLGEIVCIPPTDSARGYTFSKLFKDEAAFFENDDFFSTIAEPTLRSTNGKAVITSTPNGQKGWFFRAFDPFDDYHSKNPFHRMWLHWKHIEDKKERDAVLAKHDQFIAMGNEKKFEQEYEAKFTADARAFFDPNKVDMMYDKEMSPWHNYEKPTDLGIDVGFKTSRTIVTISRLGDDGIIRRVWHHKYPKSDDISLVRDVLELIPKYCIQRVLIDDCPAASAYIQQFRTAGVNLKLMNFKTDKTRKYVQFRSKLYQGFIRSYKDKELEKEMKAMEEIDGIRTTRIEKPKGGSDDMIDSFLISTYFFIEEKKGLRTYDWDDI